MEGFFLHRGCEIWFSIGVLSLGCVLLGLMLSPSMPWCCDLQDGGME